jgi:predicted phage terminase large subunit-like protein
VTPTEEDLAFLSLVGWCGYIDPTWRAYRHLVLLCRELEDLAFAVARGETRKLMVFMPPQHGKSSITSRAFPSWLLGRWPSLRLILASYEASYAALWGRRARDVMTEHGERVFGVRVRGDSSAADHWELARPHRGVLHTTGSTGGTGHPAEVVVIDDPVKGREEAESVAFQEKTVEWYTGSIRTRRPKGQVVVQTRWHEKDLSGWILENEPDEWRVIRLPALAEEDDPIGRPVGAALCPELQSLESLLTERRLQGSYRWASVYEQRPTPRGGGLFKRDHARHYDEPRPGVYRFLETGGLTSREHMTCFVTVDTATSTKTSADHTAIAAWGVAHGFLMLLDLDLRRMEAPEILRAIKLMGARWGAVPYVEDTTQSKHLLSFMRQQGVLFRTCAPGSADKFTRALPASALWEQGKVVTPVSAPWLSAFERQIYSFTGREGGEDDAVDCLSYAANVFSSGAGSFWTRGIELEARPANHVEAASLGGGYPG